ncbi:MAG TPA: type II CAAX endopeptidase family protein [Acidimicrobiia bacterium]|nr:type II CAAX endopeptidase family protein [Acidimicrobiia bacterium]
MPRSWSVVDFVLVWLGGLMGSAVFTVTGLALEVDDWLIIVGLIGHYLGILVVFWLLSQHKDDPGIGFSVRSRDVTYIGIGLLAQIALALVMLPISNLLLPDGGPPQVIIDIFAEADTVLLRMALVTLAVVMTPITEELVYRGVLLRALQPRGRRFAIVVSAAVFALIHFDGLDFDRLWQSAVVVLPPIFILGLLLAWVTERQGRLGPAIFIHSGWNLLAALVLLLPSELLEQAA